MSWSEWVKNPRIVGGASDGTTVNVALTLDGNRGLVEVSHDTDEWYVEPLSDCCKSLSRQGACSNCYKPSSSFSGALRTHQFSQLIEAKGYEGILLENDLDELWSTAQAAIKNVSLPSFTVHGWEFAPIAYDFRPRGTWFLGAYGRCGDATVYVTLRSQEEFVTAVYCSCAVTVSRGGKPHCETCGAPNPVVGVDFVPFMREYMELEWGKFSYPLVVGS